MSEKENTNKIDNIKIVDCAIPNEQVIKEIEIIVCGDVIKNSHIISNKATKNLQFFAQARKLEPIDCMALPIPYS